MLCCRIAARQCLRIWLPRHSSSSAYTPLFYNGARLCRVWSNAHGHQRVYASTRSEPAVIPKSDGVKSSEETVTAKERGVTTRKRRTTSKVLATPVKLFVEDDSSKKSASSTGLTTSARRGRPPKNSTATSAVLETPVPRKSRRKSTTNADKFPPSILALANTKDHWDLASYSKWVQAKNRRTDTGQHKGTCFEYVTLRALQPLGFVLHRCGRSNDLGVDLIGRWILPAEPRELKVLIQCKASQPRPAMIRELEGTWRNAPPGYSGDGVLCILVSTKPATKGVHGAMDRSQIPMAFMQITSDGIGQQLCWNSAAEARLTGLTVAFSYGVAQSKSKHGSPVHSQVSLQWMGEPWSAGMPTSAREP